MKSKPLRVDVFALARQRETLSGELDSAALPRLSESLLAPATIRFVFAGGTDDRKRPCASLSLTASLRLRCFRCAEAMDWSLKTQAPFFFVRTEDELARLPVDEADEEPLLGSASFDLQGLIEDEALLSLPLAPRHADCALPAGAAELSPEEPPEPQRRNPFEVLADLKTRRH